MMQKLNAKQIINFAFHPIGRRPYYGDTLYAFIGIGSNLQSHAFIRFNGIEIVNDLERGCCTFGKVNASYIAQIVEGRIRIRPKKVAGLDYLTAVDTNRELTKKLNRFQDRAVKFCLQLSCDRMSGSVDGLWPFFLLLNWGFWCGRCASGWNRSRLLCEGFFGRGHAGLGVLYFGIFLAVSGDGCLSFAGG